ncbi:MAG: ribosome biogenesis GTPase Der [Acidobacteriaceae bacterium]
MAPRREQKKRMGKKHRQASTRPRLGKTPGKSANSATAAASPKKRKQIAAKKAAAQKAARTPTRSPERERKVVVRGRAGVGNDGEPGRELAERRGTGRESKERLEESEERQWRQAEALAEQLSVAAEGGRSEPAQAPLVAICGRPNVGKSTLFNRLTGTRRSIVGDEPGITRDRIYGEVEWAGRTARLVDTGGVVPDDKELIPAEIFRQARAGLEEADAIILVIDGRSELASPDVDLSRLLLLGGKPVFLAVNKMDTAEMFAAAENFRSLGFRNVFPISAEHGSGIGDLLDAVWGALPGESAAEEAKEHPEGLEERAEEDRDGEVGVKAAVEAQPLPQESGSSPARRLRTHGEHIARETKIAIIGRPNVGKSTLLNALTGSERAIVSPIAGTTRDAVDEVVERDGHRFRFIDTAGIRRKGKTKLMAEKLSVIMSRKHLESADVALLVIDASESVAAADANIGGYAHESGRSVIVVVNKWDLVSKSGPDGKGAGKDQKPADKKIYEEQLRNALKFLDYAPVLFVSAAESKGMEEVFKKVELVARERRKRISTGAMNRFLEKIDFQRASVPMKRRVKIYYMTQAAVAPPTFVLFTDRGGKLHFSYERFLANEIRSAFKFIGSPIWFKLKPRNKRQAE